MLSTIGKKEQLKSCVCWVYKENLNIWEKGSLSKIKPSLGVRF